VWRKWTTLLTILIRQLITPMNVCFAKITWSHHLRNLVTIYFVQDGNEREAIRRERRESQQMKGCDDDDDARLNEHVFQLSAAASELEGIGWHLKTICPCSAADQYSSCSPSKPASPFSISSGAAKPSSVAYKICNILSPSASTSPLFS